MIRGSSYVLRAGLQLDKNLKSPVQISRIMDSPRLCLIFLLPPRLWKQFSSVPGREIFECGKPDSVSA